MDGIEAQRVPNTMSDILASAASQYAWSHTASRIRSAAGSDDCTAGLR